MVPDPRMFWVVEGIKCADRDGFCWDQFNDLLPGCPAGVFGLGAGLRLAVDRSGARKTKLITPSVMFL